MADLVQTAANVGLTDDSETTKVFVKQAGEALTQGQPVYLSAGKYFKCDVTAGLANASAAGICLSPAATDEWFVLCTTGHVDLGATLTVGETYVVSASGAISPIGDLASGDYVTKLGTAKAADTLILKIDVSGTQVP